MLQERCVLIERINSSKPPCCPFYQVKRLLRRGHLSVSKALDLYREFIQQRPLGLPVEFRGDLTLHLSWASVLVRRIAERESKSSTQSLSSIAYAISVEHLDHNVAVKAFHALMVVFTTHELTACVGRSPSSGFHVDKERAERNGKRSNMEGGKWEKREEKKEEKKVWSSKWYSWKLRSQLDLEIGKKVEVISRL
ncbi:unnamed protein product [Toxocara canis]|uniref:Uncharacterized protein n=1 Tax=Toxocara canis TaxID=6265 RepID=A0A183VC47_TOXCA|nr:unnamed protein product [Toxocara canis]